DFVIAYGNSPVGPERCISVDAFCHRAAELPQLRSRQCIDRKYLVGTSDIHHAAGFKGSDLQAEVRDGENPLQLQRSDVRSIDLLQRAIAVCTDIPVVGEPVARLWVSPSHAF